MRDIMMVIPESSKLSFILEQLRYARVISVDKGKKEKELIITIYPPRGMNTTAWAEANTKRIKSFGIKVRPDKKVGMTNLGKKAKR